MPEQCNGVDCAVQVYPGATYYSTPCGTYCSKCMNQHMEECDSCLNEFCPDQEEDDDA